MVLTVCTPFVLSLLYFSFVSHLKVFNAIRALCIRNIENWMSLKVVAIINRRGLTPYVRTIFLKIFMYLI